MASKIALVTGAPGIVGPGICRVLRGVGWKVAGHALEKDDWKFFEDIEGLPFPADIRLEADLSGREACHRIGREANERLGPITLLVNNAAFNPTDLPVLEDITEDYALQMLRVNLLAPLFLLQACLPGLKAAGGGAVINIGSIMSELPLPGQLLYPAAKAALETFTQIWSRDLALDQIRVNAIRIGSVPGASFLRPALRKLPNEKARQLHQELLPMHLEQSAAFNSLGKVITAEDVGELVAFLASAAQISGAVVPLDGGLASTRSFSMGKGNWNPHAALQEWLRTNTSSE